MKPSEIFETPEASGFDQVTHTTPEVEEIVEEQVNFICDLTGYGGRLHPNDIKHCFEKAITTLTTKHQEELVKAVEAERERILNVIEDLAIRLGENWAENDYNFALLQLKQALTPTKTDKQTEV